jgi:hypothetical protein
VTPLGLVRTIRLHLGVRPIAPTRGFMPGVDLGVRRSTMGGRRMRPPMVVEVRDLLEKEGF